MTTKVEIKGYDYYGQVNFGQTQVGINRVKLGTRDLPNQLIWIRAHSSNGGDILVGSQYVTNVVDGTGNGYILEPGAEMVLFVDNLNRVWFVATVAGCIVSWSAA
jgi:hypothetical protein